VVPRFSAVPRSVEALERRPHRLDGIAPDRDRNFLQDGATLARAWRSTSGAWSPAACRRRTRTSSAKDRAASYGGPRPPRGWQNTKSDPSPARVPLSSAQPTGPLCGEGLLDAVTDAMVALHLRYYCRVPPPPRPTCSATTCWRARSAGSTRRSRRRCSSCQRAPDVHATRKEFQAATRGSSTSSSGSQAARSPPSSPTTPLCRPRPRRRALPARGPGRGPQP
jgi:hypothetical protein